MPVELKERLATAVAEGGSNLNDVAVGALAARFGVPFEPSGRKGSPPKGAGDVLLRMPAELKERLQERAAERRIALNDLINETLAERLGGLRTGRSTKRMASSNGSNPRSEDKVRVAIIGVGNCANSLVQGVQFYKDAPTDEFVPGLMHVDLGGYHVRDIEFTAAFDVTTDKVGKDLGEAIWAQPNDTYKFAEVPKLGVPVSRGMTHDGLGKYLSQVVDKAPGDTDDVVRILQETGTDVVVNFLPVGSEEATKWYAEQILNAGCAMVNCMPVFIAKGGYFRKRFEDRGLPIIGDDIKSQVGATITHRVLTQIFKDRGVKLDRTMQLNVGGNSDFLNMLERERLESKKISKTNAVTSVLDYDLGADNVHVGPSDYVPWLTDRKWAYIRMEGTTFGNVPLNLELKLEVWDSPNSAGITIDAVRLAKLALNNGIGGALEAPSAYLMKSPPKQIEDNEAHHQVERFIAQNARTKQRAKSKA
jgi:myo-inositol-1-phosphate synthase